MALEVPGYAPSPARATCYPLQEAQGPCTAQGRGIWVWSSGHIWCLAPLGQKTSGGGDGAGGLVKVKGGLAHQKATHIMDTLNHEVAIGFSFLPRCQRT